MYRVTLVSIVVTVSMWAETNRLGAHSPVCTIYRGRGWPAYNVDNNREVSLYCCSVVIHLSHTGLSLPFLLYTETDRLRILKVFNCGGTFLRVVFHKHFIEIAKFTCTCNFKKAVHPSTNYDKSLRVVVSLDLISR